MIRVSRHNLVLPPGLGLQTRRFLDVACGDLELDFGEDVKDEDDEQDDIDDRIDDEEEGVNVGDHLHHSASR